jgi:hypothetical protein
MKSRRITFEAVDGTLWSFILNDLTLAEISKDDDSYFVITIHSIVPDCLKLCSDETYLCYKTLSAPYSFPNRIISQSFANHMISTKTLDMLYDVLQNHMLEVVTLDAAHKNMLTTEQLEERAAKAG